MHAWICAWFKAFFACNWKTNQKICLLANLMNYNMCVFKRREHLDSCLLIQLANLVCQEDDRLFRKGEPAFREVVMLESRKGNAFLERDFIQIACATWRHLQILIRFRSWCSLWKLLLLNIYFFPWATACFLHEEILMDKLCQMLASSLMLICRCLDRPNQHKLNLYEIFF